MGWSSSSAAAALFACALVALAPLQSEAQTVATVDVYFTYDNWKAAAKPKDKNDDNDYEDACIRVQGGPWIEAETKRKGSSTWQPMDKKPSLKFKDIADDLDFAGLFKSDRVVLNNDILDRGYADAYRVYREMDVYAPQAYFANVRLFKVPNTVEDCNANESQLQLAGGPDRYTVIENIKKKDFLKPRFGDCWAQWEIEGELKFDGASEDDDCSHSQDLFMEDFLENSTEVERERLRMQNLSNWHMPTLVQYIATDVIISHTDGPTTWNNNALVVRSTVDLDCDDGSEDAALCAEGGIYYPVPHGMDHTLSCHMYELTLESVWDGDVSSRGGEPRVMPVLACRDDPRCREDVERAFARGLESAHRTVPNCHGLEYWVYLVTAIAAILLASLPFGFVFVRSKTIQIQKRKRLVLFWIDLFLRLGAVAMLVMIWLPVPVFEGGDRSPFVHYYIERDAEFSPVRDNIPALVTSADYDLVGDWQGSLERMAWASALRYNGRVDTRWFYDEHFATNIENLYPDEVTRDEFSYHHPTFGERSSTREYVSACTLRNACCMVHRFYLGTNIAVFTLFLLTSIVTVFRGSRLVIPGYSKGVWPFLQQGAPFMVSLKTLVFVTHLLGVVFYYVRNMEGYYCQGQKFDDFDDHATVHFGALFFLAIAVSVLLLADAIREAWPAARVPKTKGKTSVPSIYYRMLLDPTQ